MHDEPKAPSVASRIVARDHTKKARMAISIARMAIVKESVASLST
jgi:hypothetical protein